MKTRNSKSRCAQAVPSLKERISSLGHTDKQAVVALVAELERPKADDLTRAIKQYLKYAASTHRFSVRFGVKI